jgi:hypothetical protein
MVPDNFTAPGGISHFTIAATNPDPERRYNIRVSGTFQIGTAGMRELADWLRSYADNEDAPPKVSRSKKAAASEGQDAK